MKLELGRDLTTTRDHWWWRPGWREGRRMATFHVTMERAEEIHALARAVAPVLDTLPEIGPVPLEGLHLTMNGVGFTDEVTEVQLSEISRRVFDGLADLPHGPLVCDSLLVELESVKVADAHAVWLDPLCALQRSVIDDVLGPREWGEFWPHVTLGYCTGEAPAADIVDTLLPVLPTGPLVVEDPLVTLMELGRDRKVYEWEVLRQASIGG